MTTKEIVTINKQENYKNIVKSLKHKNSNPVITPDDVDNFSEVSETQILN